MAIAEQAAMVKRVKETIIESTHEETVGKQGRLLVGEKNSERVKSLIVAGADIIAVDSAH